MEAALLGVEEPGEAGEYGEVAGMGGNSAERPAANKSGLFAVAVVVVATAAAAPAPVAVAELGLDVRAIAVAWYRNQIGSGSTDSVESAGRGESARLTGQLVLGGFDGTAACLRRGVGDAVLSAAAAVYAAAAFAVAVAVAVDAAAVVAGLAIEVFDGTGPAAAAAAAAAVEIVEGLHGFVVAAVVVVVEIGASIASVLNESELEEVFGVGGWESRSGDAEESDSVVVVVPGLGFGLSWSATSI